VEESKTPEPGTTQMRAQKPAAIAHRQQGSTLTAAHWKEKAVDLLVQYRDAPMDNQTGLVRNNLIGQLMKWMDLFPGHKEEEDDDEAPKRTVDVGLMHQTGPTLDITGAKMTRGNALLKEGRISKGVAVYHSKPLAPLNEETKDKLQDLHQTDPNPHTPVAAEEIAFEREEHTTLLTIEPEDFMKYFASRDMTSAGGPSKWNFKRIQQMLMLPEPDPTAIEGFCSMLTDIVRGLPFGTVQNDLKASRLIALTKPNAGIRPIAIGEVFTRTAVGILMIKHRTRLMAQLHDSQVGKYLGGSEAAIHTVRARLYEHPDDIFIKVDIINAFNRLSRQAVFDVVRKYVPFLLPVVALMYNVGATLTMDDGSVITSKSGVRQGDPAATILFQLALRPIIERLLDKCSEDPELAQVLQLSLYDDFAITGKPEPALRMLDMLKEELETINLEVNKTKTHVLGLQNNREKRADLRNSCFDHGIPDENIHHDYLEFLGSPIGDSESEARVCMEKVNSVFDELLDPLSKAFKNYKDSRAPKLQSLFQILRLCGYSRVNHLYRTVNPQISKISATHFDDRMWELFCTIFSIPASISEAHKRRAQNILYMPVADGGLGMPVASIRFMTAYAGSWFLTASVVEKLAPEILLVHPDGDVTGALGHLKGCLDKLVEKGIMDPYTSWATLLGENTRQMQKKLTQKAEKLAIKNICDEIAQDPTYKRMWQSSSTAKAGAWVTRIPCYKTYEMNDESFRNAILARLLLPLEELHPGAFPDSSCPLCGKHNIVNFSDHSFRCTRFTSYTQERHNAVRDELISICVHARQNTRKEWPLGDLRRLDDDSDSTESDTDEVLPKKKKHRADVTIHADGHDISKLIDVTIRLPGPNEARVGAAAARGVKAKEKHYKRVYDLAGIDLVPFAVEVWGYMSAPTCDFIDWIAQTKARNRQHPKKCPFYRKHKYQYVGRISAAIARGTGFSLGKYVYRCRRARGLLGANAPLQEQTVAI
jgi:hypothetical protein